MARGSTSKEIITAKILSMFEGSFINGKEIRLPMMEDGSPIEIKVTLTAAKDIVGGGASINDTFTPVEKSAPISGDFVTKT